MGLDKRFFTCLNKKVKRLPQKLGNVMRRLAQTFKGFANLLGRGKVKRVSPLAAERMRFEKEAADQFIKLKEKGLSIPVFTL